MLLAFLLGAVRVQAKDTTRLYQPAANAEKGLATAVATAKAQQKHVLVQVGGNWCVACYRFNALLLTDSVTKQLVREKYILFHLNYSKENRNLPTLARLGNPQRYGFPVLVVLDGAGRRIHTQDVGLLQRGNGYDEDKVRTFLQQWAPAALQPR